MKKYFELIRLPNVLTAAADSWTGFFVLILVARTGAVEPAAWGVLPCVAVVSCLLYAAGAILNDVVDFEHDKAHRPARPLPSGRISLNTAFAMAAVLVVFAMLVAMLAGTERLIIAFVLLGCIVAYNFVSKIAPAAAVLLMGLCRALNVVLGTGLAVTTTTALLIPPAFIFVYTVAICLVSLNEEKSGLAKKIVKFGVLGMPVVDAVILAGYGGAAPALFCLAISAGAVVLSKRLPVS